MFKKHNLFQISKLLLILLAFLVIIAPRGCPKRRRDTKTGGSSDWFNIAAPTNLNATVFSPNQINLTWEDNSNNEDGFEIQRRIGLFGNWVSIISVGANTEFYPDIDLFTGGLTYYYRVKAFNTIDMSDWSNIASASIVAGSVAVSGIAAGALHSIALDINGRVWSWGYNYYGQLGLYDWRDRAVPILITTEFNYGTFENVVSITAGGGDLGGGNISGHNISRKTDNTLWVWGDNTYGELGLGDNATTEAPFQLGVATDWSTALQGVIAAGGNHSIALRNDRTLWTWGRNNYGQLGLGNTADSWSPAQVLIGTDSDWSIVAGGVSHTIAIKTGGTLWTWGRNNLGQLGLGDTTNSLSPAQVVIGADTDWSMAAGGGYYTLALKRGGTLWSWGYNGSGQLGLGSTPNRWTPTQILIGADTDWSMVTAGFQHTLALKRGGTLWAWGYNYYSQLGLGSTSNRWTPAQVGTQSDWSLIDAGDNHSLGLKTNGIIWAWGRNNYGQLGLADTINRSVPTIVIFYLPDGPSALAATPVSSYQIDLAWTDNSNNEAGFRIERKIGSNGTYEEIGIVGADVTSWSNLSPTGFAPVTYYYYRVCAFNDIGNSAYYEAWTAISGSWTEIAAGGYHTLGRKTGGTLRAWGYNEYGQLGLGDSGIDRNTPTQITIGANSDWAEIACGGEHTIGRKTGGTLWAWGYNIFGQLGLGDSGANTNRNTPTQIIIGANSDWAEVVCGGGHTLGRKTGGTLWAWGYNNYGQLGLGDSGANTNRNTPTQIIIGTDLDWAEVACGGDHNLARKINGTLWSWGRNNYGQLGLGDSGTGTNRNTATRLGAASDWAEVACGGEHTLARKAGGTIWAWGRNDSGQLGLGYTTISTTGITAPIQVGNASDWVQIATGTNHTLGRKTNGTLWVWGSNRFPMFPPTLQYFYGQLGLGDTVDRNTATQIGTASDWDNVVAGSYYTLGRKLNGTIWSWGDNQLGQLGLGNTTNRTVPVLVEE